MKSRMSWPRVVRRYGIILVTYAEHSFLIPSSSTPTFSPLPTPTMRAYYFDNIPGDQRLLHDYVPSRPVSDATLAAINVKYWNIPVVGHKPKIDALAKEQGYKNRDLINVSKEGMGEVRAYTVRCLAAADLWYGADLRAKAEDVLRRVRP